MKGILGKKCEEMPWKVECIQHGCKGEMGEDYFDVKEGQEGISKTERCVRLRMSDTEFRLVQITEKILTKQ